MTSGRAVQEGKGFSPALGKNRVQLRAAQFPEVPLESHLKVLWVRITLGSPRPKIKPEALNSELSNPKKVSEGKGPQGCSVSEGRGLFPPEAAGKRGFIPGKTGFLSGKRGFLPGKRGFTQEKGGFLPFPPSWLRLSSQVCTSELLSDTLSKHWASQSLRAELSECRMGEVKGQGRNSDRKSVV